MPYVCNTCGGAVEGDVATCPSCAAPKTHWSVVAQKTLTFVVSRGFELLRGKSLRTGAPDADYADRVPAERARAVTKRAASEAAARGELPAPRDLLFVRLRPAARKPKGVELTIEYETLEAAEQAIETPAGAAPDAEGVLEVPLLFVYGPEGEVPSFDGIAVIDLGEEATPGEPGFAPSISVRALGKAWRTLPVDAAGARWSVSHAREGEPVELLVDTELADGASVTFTVLEHDADGEHDEVTTLTGEVQDGVARAPWAFELVDDADDVETSSVLPGLPEFLFRVAPDGVPLESGLLRYQSWIEVELLDQAGAPIVGRTLSLVWPDGKREPRDTDARGLARWDPVAPGHVQIAYEPAEDDDAAAAGQSFFAQLMKDWRADAPPEPTPSPSLLDELAEYSLDREDDLTA